MSLLLQWGGGLMREIKTHQQDLALQMEEGRICGTLDLDDLL